MSRRQERKKAGVVLGEAGPLWITYAVQHETYGTVIAVETEHDTIYIRSTPKGRKLSAGRHDPETNTVSFEVA